MAIRRQGFEWQVRDLGQLAPKRLEDLSNTPQSIFISGIGNATITKRNRTADDEFLVLQYTGSSPGIWPNSGNNWKPRGYINFVVETTAYFVNPDGLPSEGMPGTALPYPVSTEFSPAITDYIPIEIPPDTNWDITYFLGNSIVDPVEEFPVPNIFSWSSSGALLPPGPVYTGTPFSLLQGTAVTITPTNTGGASTNWTLNSGTLPAGLSLSASDGVISGTPTTAAGSVSFEIRATNASGFGLDVVTTTVNTNPPVFSYTSSPYTYTKNAFFGGFGPTTFGGATATGYSISPALPVGLALNTGIGSITGTPTTTTPSATYLVTATSAGGSGTSTFVLEILGTPPIISYAGAPFTLLTDGIATLTPTNTGGVPTGWTLSAGTLPTGLTLNTTTGVISGTLEAVTTTTSITIDSTNADGTGSTTFDITVDAGAPVINYATNPLTGDENVAVSATPTTSFSPITSYALFAGSLPTGVSLNTVTGVVSGTPATGSAGVYNAEIQASGPGGASNTDLGVDILPPVPVISYAGTPYSTPQGAPFGPITPTNTGGASTNWSITAGSLPTGIILDPTTGVLSGSANDPPLSSSTFTIAANNISGSGTTSVTISTI